MAVQAVLFDAKTTTTLVNLLNQALADTIDLAYQTKQAHWNVKGSNFYALHLLFDSLYTQLSTFVDELAERTVTMGGQALGTVRVAGQKSRLEEYPLDAKDSTTHVKALVARFQGYTKNVREAIHKAEELEDQDTADLFTSVSRAMDKALWMLRAHLEVA
ncbi:DNA starvation/stationary phase protection protein Dps [Geothrix sp. 21YS21S-4]|uniref:DNA starvation/stationary phase protection protein Dps n=1 Tax=Geothrix sp. 21YS21S-4 TaxID=3068889 RepID=UPI0027B9998A|nr:DNA starvation/stationary phase protection protein Dps [Geothrix sp. 21YS21S-4]